MKKSIEQLEKEYDRAEKGFWLVINSGKGNIDLAKTALEQAKTDFWKAINSL